MSSRDRVIVLEMARALLRDIQDIQQRGAGYYSTAPFVERYNRLVGKTQAIFADTQSALLDTFVPVDDTKSVDPADKMKTTQRVIVEVGQLIAFMESIMREEEGEVPPPLDPNASATGAPGSAD